MEVALESTLRAEFEADSAFAEDLSAYWRANAPGESRPGGLDGLLGNAQAAQLQELVAMLGADGTADADLVDALMRSMMEK